MAPVDRATYHHGDLRRAIVGRALAVLAERGAGALSLRGLARELGVSHQAPYRHFRDKDELLAALAREGFDQLSAAMDAVTSASPDDPRKQLIAAGEAYVEHATGQPALYDLMFGGQIPQQRKTPELRDSAAGAFQRLVEIIAFGQRANVYRRGDPRQMAAAAWAIVHGVASLLNSGSISAGRSSLKKFVRGTCVMLEQGFLET